MSDTPPLIWLWLAGRDLDGKKRTNATWRHDATDVLIPGLDCGPWTRMRRRRRSAIRQAALVTIPAVAWDLRYHLADTLALLAFLAILLAVHSTYNGAVRLRLWQHHRAYTGPLEHALRAIVPIPARPEIEPDRSRVTIWLPEHFTAGDTGRERAAIAQAVTAKVAIEAPEADWSNLEGRKPHVIFTKSQPPPPKVTPADLIPAIQAAKEDDRVLGLGKKAVPVVISVHADEPHLGESMKPGDGKSEIAKNNLTQALWHGGLGVILDIKLISHMWARGLPNVAYAGTPYEIHHLLLWLREEIARRNAAALASADIEGRVHGNVGPRITVIAEELNVTQGRLKAWWKEDGKKGTPPSADALDDALFIGRQVRVNVVLIGQRLSAKATSGSGSADSRVTIGPRILCDPDKATWDMLGYGHAQPPASGHKGRYQVVTPDAVREFQGPLWTGAQAREFAVSGTVAVPRHDMPYTGSVAPVPAQNAIEAYPSDLGIVVGQSPPGVRPPGTATIREALDAGLFGRCTVGTARKRVQRAKEVGKLTGIDWEGNAELFPVDDLKELVR